MSVEISKSIADWATILLIALTVVSGSAALILGDRMNKKQAKQLQQFSEELIAAKTGLAQAQEESAEAQLALRKYIDNVARHQGRRSLDRHAFLEELKDKPTGRVDIRYKENDSEAYWFAFQVWKLLDDAGWGVSNPLPFSEDIALPGSRTDSGITIVAKDASGTMGLPSTSLNALSRALGFGMGGGMGTGLAGKDDPNLSKDSFILFIGQKP